VSVDLWAALAALLVASILATVAALVAVPPEVQGAFFGAATMLVTFAAGAVTRDRVEHRKGRSDE